MTSGFHYPVCIGVAAAVKWMLLLHDERSHFRWFGHLVNMPPEHLPGEVFWAYLSRRRPGGSPGPTGGMAQEPLWISLEVLVNVAGKREVCASLLRLLYTIQTWIRGRKQTNE